MESTRSIDDHLHQHGRSTTGDVPAGSKSKYGSHKSLSATNSTSSLSIDGGGGAGHRRSHPSLSSRYSTSDSRLSHSSDNVNNPHQKRGGSRSKRRLPRLDLSLDSKPKGFQPGRHDPNSTLESTEDEDRTSADEYSTEDDADSSLRSGDGDGKHGGGDQHQALNSSVSSATSYVDKAVEELIATERTYVRDLHDVIQVLYWLFFKQFNSLVNKCCNLANAYSLIIILAVLCCFSNLARRRFTNLSSIVLAYYCWFSDSKVICPGQNSDSINLYKLNSGSWNSLELLRKEAAVCFSQILVVLVEMMYMSIGFSFCN